METMMTTKMTTEASGGAFDKIMDGLADVLAYQEGRADVGAYRVHVPARVDVKAIRKAQGLTQDEFSERYGLPVATVRDWEQERREPDTGSRLLLRVIEREPEAVTRALSRA